MTWKTTTGACCWVLAWAFSACGSARRATEAVVAERVSADTLRHWRTVETHDTVVERDSVFLFKDGSRIVVRDRYRSATDIRHDTLWRTRTDTVPRYIRLTQTVTREVAAPLAWWQRLLMWTGGFCVMGAVGWLVIWARMR